MVLSVGAFAPSLVYCYSVVLNNDDDDTDGSMVVVFATDCIELADWLAGYKEASCQPKQSKEQVHRTQLVHPAHSMMRGRN